MLRNSYALKPPIGADDSVPSSLPCDSKLVYFNGHVVDSSAALLPPHPELDSLEGDSMDQFIVATEMEAAGSNRIKSPLGSKDTLDRTQEAVSAAGNNHRSGADLVQNVADTLEDSLDFFVDDFQLHPHDELMKTATKSAIKAEKRWKEPSRNNRYELGGIHDSHASLASMGRLSDGFLRLVHERQDDIVIEEEDSDGEDTDDLDMDALSLDGTQLTAIFQRNVRRYEILRGFEATTQGQPPRRTAWNQLHQLLEANSNSSPIGSKPKRKPEASLVASSRWMPSSVLTGGDP